MRRDAAASRHIPEQIKTKRAYRTCHQLIETAEWLREELSSQLANFDLTWTEFRVLDVLYHEGGQYQQRLSRRFRCSRQNMQRVILRLVECGWVRRDRAVIEESLPNGKTKVGREIRLLRLTPKGEKKIAEVFPHHTKVVKCYLRALGGRQQQTLARLCGILREDYAIKFIREFEMEDEDEVLDWKE